MTVSRGRDFLALPGPTTVPHEVLQAMQRPAVDIYGEELTAVTDSCLDDLRRVFRTEHGRTYIYIANGHGAWEAALTNVLSRGDKVLVLESGRFAIGWGEMAEPLGIEVEVLEAESQAGGVTRGAGAAPPRRSARARSRPSWWCRWTRPPVSRTTFPRWAQPSRRAVTARFSWSMSSPRSARCRSRWTSWGVDVAVAGAQKGLMMTPGLSFIAASEKALAAHADAGLRTRYWDWTVREGELHYMKYCGTPPVHLLFGLRKSLDMLFEEGLESAFRRHELLAGATQAAVGRWSEAGALSFNVPEPAERSPTVTTILMEDPALSRLLDWSYEVCNVSLGIGLGPLSGHAFRIAHMGHVNAPMTLGTLGAIETGLAALDIPHGKGGVSAAIDYLGIGSTDIVKRPSSKPQGAERFFEASSSPAFQGFAGCA